MAKYLTQEWLDENVRLAASVPDRPGVGASMQFRVTNMPGRAPDCWYSWQIDEGRVREAALGQVPDPDLTVTISYADSRLVHEGELDPNVAFMQGRLKVAGDNAKLMAVLRLAADAGQKALQQQVCGVTEW